MSLIRRSMPGMPLLVVLAAGLLVAGCGGGSSSTGSTSPAVSPAASGAATEKAAITAYCDANGITMADLSVSGLDGEGDQPTVSAQDPSWRVDYAFPAVQEGAGQFFLLHKTASGWTALAATRKAGWTSAQLAQLGAPTDMIIDPTREPAPTQTAAITAYCKAAGITIPDMIVNAQDKDSEPPVVSKTDPGWEVDYAFPAAAEGKGTFFLVHKVGANYKVIADTKKAGWTAAQLKALGAPSDLTLDQTQ